MDILADLGITTHATYVPHDTPRDERPMLWWRVSLRRHGKEFFNTEYRAGCAHSPTYKRFGRCDSAVRSECETGIVYGTSRPVPPPPAADVVQCLLVDSSGTDQSFDEWAVEHGYDTDSRSAERVFSVCQETAAALGRTFTKDEMESLREAFSNY